MIEFGQRRIDAIECGDWYSVEYLLYFKKMDALFLLDECYLNVSNGELFQDYYWPLIDAIQVNIDLSVGRDNIKYMLEKDVDVIYVRNIIFEVDYKVYLSEAEDDL